MTAFISPLDIAFEFTDTVGLLLLCFEYITFAVFVADIFISMATSYFNEENEEVIDLKMCAKEYIKSPMFTFDLLSTLPIYEVSQMLAFGGGSVT